MPNKPKFIPDRQAIALAKAKQMHDQLTATGADPTALGLSADDVTQLGTLYTAAQGAFDARQAANEQKKAATQALSAPAATLDQLEAHMRDIGNKARVSNASDDAIAAIGVTRRDPQPTPKTVSLDAPEFTLDSVQPGFITVRFRDKGSAHPRARAANAIGIQIAVVNGANPAADGEADTVPYLFVPRSPASLDSSRMPDQVRLYARWFGARGRVSAWSLPLQVTVV